MKRTQEDAEQTKQNILDAALTVFSQVGYESARLNDIAERADVTRGAIYHHFENKVGLFMALIDDANTIGNKAIEQAMEGGGTFIDVMKRILIFSMELLEEDRRFREITTLALFETAHSDELKDYRQRQLEQSTLMVDSIAGFFRMGIESGQVRQNVDPNTAARAFLAYQSGLSMLWITNPKGFSIKAEASKLAEIFIEGIKA